MYVPPADPFGLAVLTASGYRALAAVFLLVYVVPLLSIGVFRLWRRRGALQGVP